MAHAEVGNPEGIPAGHLTHDAAAGGIIRLSLNDWIVSGHDCGHREDVDRY